MTKRSGNGARPIHSAWSLPRIGLGSIYLVGRTTSSDFPVLNAIQDSYTGGDPDVFVAKLHATTLSPIYSTFIGDTGWEDAWEVAVDGADNVYISGGTSSVNFPVVHSVQGALGGEDDAFLMELSPTGDHIIYSTFLGGSSWEYAFGLGVTSDGHAAIVGSTWSTDLPLHDPLQAAQGSMGEALDAFIAHIGPQGDAQPPEPPTHIGASSRTATTMALAWDAASDNVGVTGYDIYRDTTLLGSSATTAYTVTGLSSSTIYTFTVQARDAAGNVSAPSAPLQLRTADVTPPAAPTNLRAEHMASTRVVLAWDGASDDIAVTGYDIYASTTKIGETSDTTFAVENLQVLAAYQFHVVARDADGNESAPSQALSVTTPDTDAPETPTHLQVVATSDTTASLSWDAATDNVGTTGYTVYDGATALGTTPATNITLSGLQPGTTYALGVRAEDAAGNESPLSAGVLVQTTDTVAPTTPTNLRLVRVTDRVAALAWDAAGDTVGVMSYTVRVGGAVLRTTALTETTLTNLQPASAYAVTVEAVDAAGNASPATAALYITTLPDDGLPDDPRDVAPPTDLTVVSDIGADTSFLYTGPNPIQTGVVAGTIDPERVTILRGLVQTRAGVPLPGVTISVLDHPEFGSTRSRADGAFDLAVNGGGVVTLNYAHSAYLPAQRQVEAPWREYATLPTVALVPVDTQQTDISLTGSQPLQVVRGSAVQDADGARQATVLFPAGVTASMEFATGNPVPLTDLTVSVTEYTVGANGPEAMPGVLPPNSGYTYAADFRVAEAVQAGATSVNFSAPVYAYVENFLDFDVGETVPSGYYDFTKAAWVPGDNGLVIKIVGVANGRALIDRTGDEVADTLTGFMAEAEQQKLAELYPVGQELWRVPLDHFTPWDFNWPYGPPAGAIAPDLPPTFEAELDATCDQDLTLIACENQTLHTAMPVLDTALALHYASDRVPGRTAAYAVQVPVMGATVPSGLLRVDVTLAVAGQTITRTLTSPSPEQVVSLSWNGLDAYGRPVQGEQAAQVRVAYVYGPASYTSAVAWQQAFAQFSESGGAVGRARTTGEYTLAQTWRGRMGVFQAVSQGLGGMTLTAHHVYDPNLQTIHYGSGSRRQLDGTIITTLAGTDEPAPSDGTIGDGDAATAAWLSGPSDVAVDAQGRIYIADTEHHRLRRVSAAGVITTVAGKGYQASGLWDDENGPLANPSRIALAPNGDLYVAEYASLDYSGDQSSLTRIHFSGMSYTLTRNQAFGTISGIAVARDGTVYVADQDADSIRFLSPGSVTPRELLLGATTLRNPAGLALDSAGNLYIADSGNDRVLQVRPDKSVVELISAAAAPGFIEPLDIEPDANGDLYISANGYVWRWMPNGPLTIYAGAGSGGTREEGGPAGAAALDTPRGLARSPNGSLVVADPTAQRVWRVASVLPVTANGEWLIPHEDGSVVDVFDRNGRHRRTLDATTGVVLAEFDYDGNHQLTTITDNVGRVTTISRSGTAVAVTAPSGATTSLTINSLSRYATAVTTQGPTTTRLDVAPTGLLQALTNPQDGRTSYDYTAGRLSEVTTPAGGVTQLGRVATSPISYTVRVTDALLHAVDYQLELPATGEEVRTQRSVTGVIQATKGISTATILEVDGTTTRINLAPDPRWGMLAPVAQQVWRLVGFPGAPFATVKTTATVTGLSPTDPFIFSQLTAVTEVNGHVAGNQQVTTSIYRPASREYAITDPSGQVTVRREDARGRVLWEQSGALPAVSYSYLPINAGAADSGLLQAITETPLASANPTGEPARTTSFTYDAHGYLDVVSYPQGSENYDYTFPAVLGYRMTMQPSGLVVHMQYAPSGEPVYAVDPQGVVSQYFYDASRRLERQLVGGGAETVATIYGYNAADLLTSISVNGEDPQLTTILPKVVGIDTYRPGTVEVTGGARTVYTYQPDGQVATITRALDSNVSGTTTFSYYPQGWLQSEQTPGGRQTSYTYRPDGLVETITDPRGSSTAYTYDAAGRTKTVKANTTTVDDFGPVNALTEYIYDTDTNRIVKTTDPRNQSWVWEVRYDGYGRVWQEIDPLGNRTTTLYDPLGYPRRRVVGEHETEPAQPITTDYDYDPHGRLLSEHRDPSGLNLTTTYSYQRAGGAPQWQVGSVTDPRGATTRYSYNGRGLLASTTDAHNQVWHFAYNNLGQLVRQGGPEGWVQYTNIDLEARTVTETDGGRQQTTRYRLDGHVASVTDFAGQVTTYVYTGTHGLDGLVTRIEAPGDRADVEEFIYDAAGNLTTMRDSVGDTSYRYDGLNRLRQQTRTNTGAPARTIDYAYDAAGNTTNISYFGLGSVGYTYDAAGRVATLSPWGAPATTYEYYSNGLLERQTRGNGVSTSYSYDGAGRLDELVHARGSTTLETIAYEERDANGNVKERVDGDGRTNYSYDALNRLTAVSYPALATGASAYAEGFTYDARGNRTHINNERVADYAPDNRIAGQGRQDANGNLLSAATSDGSATTELTYRYDGANRLYQIEQERFTPGSTTFTVSTYRYDGQGRQVARESELARLAFVYDERGATPQVLAELATEALPGIAATRLYAYGPGGIAAQRTIDSDSGDSIQYPLLDQLGTPRGVTDTSGAPLLWLSYDAFGTERAQEVVGQAPFGMGFTGGLQDPLTGNLFLRARSYTPTSGRFVQRSGAAGDVSQPQSLNRYVYAANNPVNQLDPGMHCRGGTSCRFIIDQGRQPWNWNTSLDSLQFGIDMVGVLPGPTDLADGVNALISLARGNYGDAALSAVAMIPFVGWGATASKNALKYSDEAAELVTEGSRVWQSRWATRELQILAFRGAGPEYKYFVEAGEPLIWAGHVGISFDRGKTIIGFTPYAPGKSFTEVVDSMVKHWEVYPGQVLDDTKVFHRAQELAETEGLRTQVWVWSQRISRQDFNRMRRNVMAELGHGPLPGKYYGFPQDIHICYNCATWPGTHGVNLPEDTGQLRFYMDAMEKLGTRWALPKSR